MRTWSMYFLALIFLAGCSTSSITGVSDVSDGDLDVRSRGDLLPTDMSLEVDTHSDTKPDEVEVTDPCVPPAELLCPCEEGKDCLSGFCELHLGEQLCTQTCVEECPPGYGCVQYSAGGPDAGHVCMSLYPSLCVPCKDSGDCHGDDECFVHGPEAGAFCSPWCGADHACPTGYTCAALDTVTGVPGFACVPDDGECLCSRYSINKHKSTVCEMSNELGTCGGVRICEEDGLSPCSAPVPEDEVCGDGVDNDCDGFTDPVVLCHDCECGDGECDPACGEDVAGDDFCPADCCLCGDGVCEPDPCGEGWEEGLKTCALDCAICGDGVCDPAEGPQACPEDCCGTCGDGKCKCSENPDACPEDCGQWACGDGTCNPGENPIDCPQDCEPYACGNGTCEPGENPATCPDDCGSACGNCECEGGESYDTCPVDCGFCGDGFCISKCDYNEETPGVCETDCPPDCTPECDGKDCGADGCGGTCGICTGQDKCVQGVCVCQPACDGKECGSDGCGGECGVCAGTFCLPEGCVEGLCMPSDPPDCDDENECTEDSCSEGACLNVPQWGHPCDDGEFCSTEDSCGGEDGSFCEGGGWEECDDGNPCTNDQCIEGGVGCYNSANDEPCDDGDLCTDGDQCAEESCVSGLPLDCDDGNDCTGTDCDPASGCTYPTLDGQPCAGGAGVCQGDTCCVPDCTSKDCGDDGCGGSCGLCPEIEDCEAGFCQCPTDDPNIVDCGEDVGCADISSNPEHCGWCGNDCAMLAWPNVAAYSCVDSACGILACDNPFVDVDETSWNGCECEQTSPVESCDLVDNNCNGEVDEAPFDDCQLPLLCQGGFCGCDLTQPNLQECAAGQCIDVLTDPNHCGFCGNNCDALQLPNVQTYSCEEGLCVIDACVVGTFDVDTSSWNGCECQKTAQVESCDLVDNNCNGEVDETPNNCVPPKICMGGQCICPPDQPNLQDCAGPTCTNTDVDPNNCGFCGHVCALPNVAFQSCAAGECVVVGCQPGWKNCDGQNSTGCDFQIQPEECNGFDDDCDGGIDETFQCSPGETETQACGNCGTQNRVCNNSCSWGSYGSCGGQGVCSPGQTQSCGASGSQSCNNSCQWNSCEG